MKVEITEIEERSVMAVRSDVSMNNIGDVIGRLTGEIMAATGERGTGPVISRYLEWEDDGGVLEMSRAVSGPCEETDRVYAATLPGGRAAVGMHEGSYDGLYDSWTAFKEWMEENGVEKRGPGWEEYLNDCSSTPEADLRTRIVWPVK